MPITYLLYIYDPMDLHAQDLKLLYIM